MNTQSVNKFYKRDIPWREFMENIGIVLLECESAI